MNAQSHRPAATGHEMAHASGRGPRPAWRRQARPVAAVTVLAGAALLAAACGGSPSPTGSGGSPGTGGSAPSPPGVAYSRCIRAHGVPDFPDPGPSGQIPKAAVISAFRQVGDSRAQAATRACENLNPAGQTDPVLTVSEQQDYLRAAACMRSHGITSFPDPTFPGGRINLAIPPSIDTKSAQFIQAAQLCTKLIPAGLPHARG